jgi:Tfp pilus assembly protein PilO
MNGIFDISTQEKRERLLLILAAVVLVCVVVPFCYNYFNSSITKLRNQKSKLEDAIKKLEIETKDEKHIRQRLAELNEQSLPPGETVKSQYQNWVIDTANSVGLKERKISSASEQTVKKGYYKQYKFTFTCRGTLEQIADFLRRFHKTDYLHLVRQISPKPINNSNLMDVSIKIEAVSITKSQSDRTLRVVPADKIKITPEEKKILNEIKTRKLFSAYTPPQQQTPPPPPPPKPPQFYQAPYCYVIAILEINGKKQVWIDHRSAGKQYKLHEGESFQLEGVECIIEKIEFDKIHVEADKQKFIIKQGKSFAEYE